MNLQTGMMPKSHHVRTVFAALFGIIAVWLILTSILVVWVNRTLTDTTTFSSTVAPLATKPAVQDFVIQKVDDAITKNNSVLDLAGSLLPASEISLMPVAQLQTQVNGLIKSNVTTIVQSPQFAALWQTTTVSAQTQLINQLKSDNTNLTIDLSSAVTAIIAQLKQTDLAPISDKITVTGDTGKLNLKGSGIVNAHHYYKMFQGATIGIVLLAIIMIALAVIVSVHHTKTIRRILLVTGIESLILAAALQIPNFIKAGTGDGHLEKAAALAFAQVLLHNLQVASLIIGVICVVVALGSKLYSNMAAKKKKPSKPSKSKTASKPKQQPKLKIV
jgi:hypothetical protein